MGPVQHNPSLPTDVQYPSSENEQKCVESQSMQPTGWWSRIGFGLLNIWLVFHLFAISIAPASVQPSSRLEQSGWKFAGPYLQLLYLNHGFHFFAPEPAGATTVEYRLQFEDGSIEEGKFPHRGIEPRLLYHRHLMLTEFLASNAPEDVEEQKIWYEAYARNLCRESGAVKVTLIRVRHHISSQVRILAGGKLDDPEMFERETIGTYDRSQL